MRIITIIKYIVHDKPKFIGYNLNTCHNITEEFWHVAFSNKF